MGGEEGVRCEGYGVNWDLDYEEEVGVGGNLWRLKANNGGVVFYYFKIGNVIKCTCRLDRNLFNR